MKDLDQHVLMLGKFWGNFNSAGGAQLSTLWTDT